MEEYKIGYKRGVDDLLSNNPYQGDGQYPTYKGRFNVTEEHYNNNPVNYGLMVREYNNWYINSLKSKGEYGETYYIHINFEKCKGFDEY